MTGSKTETTLRTDIKVTTGLTMVSTTGAMKENGHWADYSSDDKSDYRYNYRG